MSDEQARPLDLDAIEAGIADSIAIALERYPDARLAEITTSIDHRTALALVAECRVLRAEVNAAMKMYERQLWQSQLYASQAKTQATEAARLARDLAAARAALETIRDHAELHSSDFALGIYQIARAALGQEVPT